MSQWIYVYRQWLLRELQLRFRSSAVGAGWLVLQPLVHIVLFTLVFYQFFQIRWPTGNGTAGEYGLQVFIGLSLYIFVADVINRSPGSIWSFPYLVTKVRFPLALLPAVIVGASMVQLVLSLLLAAAFAALHGFHMEVLWLPVALVPLGLYALALSWLLGAAGVYLRDIGHLAPSVSSLLLFLTPIFYPASMVPASMQWLVACNPLAWTSETARSLITQGAMLDWSAWGVHVLLASVFMIFARWFFHRIQPGFADVL